MDFDPDDTATYRSPEDAPADVERVRPMLSKNPTPSRVIMGALQIGESRVLAALAKLGATRTPFGWTK